MTNKITEWNTQIKRGTLELCILKSLNNSPKYGYEIIQVLNQHPLISSKESTVYPLLRRLEKEGILYSYWEENTQGIPPRKYYSLTESGREYLQEITKLWQELQETISKI
ncbi:PadR family transcriptional regulator [Actinomyces sp. zg-332]|uniref:PadR family transcriptional regulator n=1 Tax=Actinomyces sp. zg-332 TaxID=2708340 RepID=UPI0014235133|nr:PadR family transcriptional regulator [Actinomyces sp. zg-332]QPK93643.1 PadR family transcriptional regulator [Actinomyces sp. zg-332]